MPDVWEDFNPDATLRVLPSFSIEKRDGSVIDLGTTPLGIRGGANIVTSVDEDSTEIYISVDTSGGTEDPYFAQKRYALEHLTPATGPDNPLTGPYPDPVTGVTPTGPPWSFTWHSLWIGRINEVLSDPLSGAFFIVGDRCTSFGTFEHANRGYPVDQIGAAIEMVDVCSPCLDCLTYQRLNEFIERIRVFYDYLYALAANTDTANPPEHPDGGFTTEFSGTFVQALSALRYWDYLVHESTVKHSSEGQGQCISAAGYYLNISNAAIPADTVVFLYRFTFLRIESGTPCLWEGISEDTLEVRGIARPDVNNAIVTGIQYFNSGGIPLPGCNTGPGAHTVQVTMTYTSELPSTEDVYADVVLLIKDTEMLEDPNIEYQVYIQMNVQGTHLNPGGSISRTSVVFFKPA